jgi:uncharacterized protein
MKLLGAWLYPVKSMRGVQVDALTLDDKGIVGDRRWMLVDAENQFLTQRAVPALVRLQPTLMPGGVRLDDGAQQLEVATPPLTAARRHVTVWRDRFDALDAGDEAAQWLSARIGQPCRLVAFADDVRREVDVTYARDAQTTFTDAYPLLITNEVSLDALNAKLEVPLTMDRFRPNLVVREGPAWAEDGWAHLTIDGLPFEGVKPCARCVAITTDQRTGERPQGSKPLTALAELHALPGKGALFGMNLVHRRTGTLQVGADVRLTAG